MGKALRLVLALFVLLPSVLFSPPQPSAAADEEYAIANGYFYSQTAGTGRGYSVVDDAQAPFYREFLRLGGVQGVGYPISRRFLWNGFICQVFQRVVFQWNPQTGQVAFVNVFDLLSQAGQDETLFNTRSVPRPLPADFDGGKPFAQVIEDRLALLDANPAIRNAYNSVVGDPVTMNGLPTSQVTDMGNHFALRTQRVLFQQWKVAVPWAAAGQVTMALGGSIAAEMGVFPASVLEAEIIPNESAAKPLVNVPLPSAGTLMPPVAPPTTRKAPLGYGFQLDPSEQYERALGLVTSAGFNWVKYQVRWSEFEKQPGTIDWTFLDKVVNGNQAAQTKLLLSVVTAPDWARAGQDLSHHGPPTDPATYARFVSALTARYKGKISAIEVWNEQNLGREFGGPSKQSAPAYVALLRAAYTAIKANDPNILVVVGALTPAGNVNIPSLGGVLARDDVEFLSEMYDAGMKGFFDVIGVHPSGFNNAPDLDPRDQSVLDRSGGFHAHRSFYFRNFEYYYEVMTARGDADKQLFFTEFGWASGCSAASEWAYAHENTEQQQAEWLVKAFQIAKDRPYVGAMFVWNLNFFGVDDAKCAFSVLNRDWSPRPAYTALKSLAK